MPGATPETKLVLIPNITHRAIPRLFDCMAVITNRRFLFVRTGVFTAEGLGFDAAKALSGGMGPPSPIDYVNEPPDALAAREGALSIPFEAVSAIVLKKPSWDSEAFLQIEYRDAQGGAKKFIGLVAPTADQLKNGKLEGRKAKEVRALIARAVQDVLRQHLPPPLVAAAKWEA